MSPTKVKNMPKRCAMVYTDSELLDIAHNRNINISAEFTEWLRNRLVLPATFLENEDPRMAIERKLMQKQDEITALLSQMKSFESDEILKQKAEEERKQRLREKAME